MHYIYFIYPILHGYLIPLLMHFSASMSEEPDPDTTEIRTSAPLYSCMQPVDLAQHIADLADDDILCISPAEGNKPVTALSTEANCFPAMFPDGQNTYNQERPIKLGLGRYFNQRLFNIDNTFASDPTYIFWAQYVKELNE